MHHATGPIYVTGDWMNPRVLRQALHDKVWCGVIEYTVKPGRCAVLKRPEGDFERAGTKAAPNREATPARVASENPF